MSLTIDGSTNTLTASSGLTVSGNTAVTGTLSATLDVRLAGNSFSRIGHTDPSGGFIGGYNVNVNSGIAQHDSLGASCGVYNSTSGMYLYAEGSAAAGTALTPRVTISSTGLAVTGTLSATTGAAVGGATAGAGGIAFPATQVAVADPNTLDDYEEGTWTPNVGGNATYTIQEGYYIKIGRLVFIQAKIVINVLGTGSTTTISGLPYTALNSANASAGGGVVNYFTSLAVSTISLTPFAVNNSATVVFGGMSASGTTMNASLAVFGSSTRIDFSLTYYANA